MRVMNAHGMCASAWELTHGAEVGCEAAHARELHSGTWVSAFVGV